MRIPVIDQLRDPLILKGRAGWRQQYLPFSLSRSLSLLRREEERRRRGGEEKGSVRGTEGRGRRRGGGRGRRRRRGGLRWRSRGGREVSPHKSGGVTVIGGIERCFLWRIGIRSDRSDLNVHKFAEKFQNVWPHFVSHLFLFILPKKEFRKYVPSQIFHKWIKSFQEGVTQNGCREFAIFIRDAHLIQRTEKQFKKLVWLVCVCVCVREVRVYFVSSVSWKKSHSASSRRKDTKKEKRTWTRDITTCGLRCAAERKREGKGRSRRIRVRIGISSTISAPSCWSRRDASIRIMSIGKKVRIWKYHRKKEESWKDGENYVWVWCVSVCVWER